MRTSDNYNGTYGYSFGDVVDDAVNQISGSALTRWVNKQQNDQYNVTGIYTAMNSAVVERDGVLYLVFDEDVQFPHIVGIVRDGSKTLSLSRYDVDLNGQISVPGLIPNTQMIDVVLNGSTVSSDNVIEYDEKIQLMFDLTGNDSLNIAYNINCTLVPNEHYVVVSSRVVKLLISGDVVSKTGRLMCRTTY